MESGNNRLFFRGSDGSSVGLNGIEGGEERGPPFIHPLSPQSRKKKEGGKVFHCVREFSIVGGECIARGHFIVLGRFHRKWYSESIGNKVRIGSLSLKSKDIQDPE